MTAFEERVIHALINNEMTCEFSLGEDGLDYVLQSVVGGSCENFAFIKDVFRFFVKDFFVTWDRGWQKQLANVTKNRECQDIILGLTLQKDYSVEEIARFIAEGITDEALLQERMEQTKARFRVPLIKAMIPRELKNLLLDVHEEMRNYWVALMFLSYEMPMFMHGQNILEKGCRGYKMRDTSASAAHRGGMLDLYVAALPGYYPLRMDFKKVLNRTKLSVNAAYSKLESDECSLSVIRQSALWMNTFHQECYWFFPKEIMTICMQYVFSAFGFDKSRLTEKTFETQKGILKMFA